MKDCIIIGGGPAGLTAALYLARFMRNVMLFDASEGRAQTIPQTHNLSPFPDGISGRELIGRMQSHAEQFGAALEKGSVSAIEKHADEFHVTTDRGVDTSRSLILASGVVNHRPPLPAGDHDIGLSRGLLRYCPVCDAYEVRGKRIAVLGKGAHGAAEAAFLTQYSSDVTLIPLDGTFTVPTHNLVLLAGPMRALTLSDSAVTVTSGNGKVENFDTLYIALGTSPRSDLAATLGARLSKDGCVIVDAKQETNIKGVYAIGDVTEGLDQISCAMGQGATAAVAIHNDLRNSVRE